MIIDICSRRDVIDRIRDFGPHSVVSIVDPGEREAMDRELAGRARQIHSFAFRDLAPPILSVEMPQPKHLELLFRKLDGSPDISRAKVLFHCREGISRSSAMAVVALAYEHSRIMRRAADVTAADRIAEAVLDAQALAMPNRKILADAENLLPEWSGLIAAPFMPGAEERPGTDPFCFESEY